MKSLAGLFVTSVLFSAAYFTEGLSFRRESDHVDASKVSNRKRTFRKLATEHVGNDDDAIFPLQRCQGDCDTDEDCEGSLVCYQRDSGSTSVPGCGSTSSSNSVDYCIRPSDLETNDDDNNDDDDDSGGGAFRLKLHWEDGYDWQNDSSEKKWCMQCAGSDCDEDEKIHVQKCGDDNTWFVFDNMSSDGSTQIRVADEDLCLEVVSARDLRVRRCDAWENKQYFRPGIGSFRDNKFELENYVYEGCLTQQHHPKEGEEIKNWPCSLSREDFTNFWNRY